MRVAQPSNYAELPRALPDDWYRENVEAHVTSSNELVTEDQAAIAFVRQYEDLLRYSATIRATGTNGRARYGGRTEPQSPSTMPVSLPAF